MARTVDRIIRISEDICYLRLLELEVEPVPSGVSIKKDHGKTGDIDLRMLLEEGDRRVAGIRIPFVVGVKEVDVAAGCMPHPRVAGRTEPAVGLVDIHDVVGVPISVTFTNVGRAVGTAVVHQNNLYLVKPHGLGNDALDRLFEIGFHVVCRNDK